jgi:hypothetical protein
MGQNFSLKRRNGARSSAVILSGESDENRQPSSSEPPKVEIKVKNYTIIKFGKFHAPRARCSKIGENITIRQVFLVKWIVHFAP